MDFFEMFDVYGSIFWTIAKKNGSAAEELKEIYSSLQIKDPFNIYFHGNEKYTVRYVFYRGFDKLF